MTFPGPVEDIIDAINWVLKNPEYLSVANATIPDLGKLFIMGHSTGAPITATLFLLPEILASKNFQTKISGIVLVSGTYHFHRTEWTAELSKKVITIWGSKEALDANALLENASLATLLAYPETLIAAGSGS